MIRRFRLRNFTLFREEELILSPNLNIIIGENGCGKSHLLKALYSLVSVSAEQGRKVTNVHAEEIKRIDFFIESIKKEHLSQLVQSSEGDSSRQKSLKDVLKKENNMMILYLEKEKERLIEKNSSVNKPTKSFWEKACAEKLNNVLRPEKLGNLAARHGTGDDDRRTELFINNDDERLDIGISFSAASQSEVRVDSLPQDWIREKPTFFPARELLTLYPGFVATYDNHYLEFEETYRDTCLQLGLPALRGERELRAKALLQPIEEVMGGEVILDSNGRFYLQQEKKRIEMPLVAEGLRKFAMLAQLIATGALLDKGYLFWDEPEANLNPKLIKTLAKIILDLCKQGIQVFIATHSLFLLRELEILQKDEEYRTLSPRYFGLNITSDGVKVEQGDEIYDLSQIVVLDESLLQADRYLEMD
ncbi:AAA family ATPase [Aeromonas rivipollensis]|uniref:AAA family ATPase n=1 Tax=Aeromonas rivipollensis TaxID=948519 RepID=UPI00259E19DF|nr:ATP-binding protein [Aeromonas rivipollensis]MDM5085595.1 AAA family ATPase [Aeromonas rivipollensis]MDM5097973.1 AAA family ATPase [Aeromonas rivipollensis]MDM5106259.1 AAA family ATPase [Aeromonas rivipollensis]